MELPPSVKRSISQEEEEGETTLENITASAVFSRALNDKDIHVHSFGCTQHTHIQNISCHKQDNWGMPLKIRNSIMSYGFN